MLAEKRLFCDSLMTRFAKPRRFLKARLGGYPGNAEFPTFPCAGVASQQRRCAF
jgi:hypothetical protein